MVEVHDVVRVPLPAIHTRGRSFQLMDLSDEDPTIPVITYLRLGYIGALVLPVMPIFVLLLTVPAP